MGMFGDGVLGKGARHQHQRPLSTTTTRAFGWAASWLARKNGTGVSAGLPMSLFSPVQRLPGDGQLVSADQATCDPDERSCQTLMYVWEDKCTPCSGTGQARAGRSRRVRAGRGGRRASASMALCTCMACHGLGIVRRTSSREEAVPSGALTLGRPQGQEGYQRDSGPVPPARRSAPGSGGAAQQGRAGSGATPRMPSLGELKERRRLQQQREQQQQVEQPRNTGAGVASQPAPTAAQDGVGEVRVSALGSRDSNSSGSQDSTGYVGVQGLVNGNGEYTTDPKRSSNGTGRSSREPAGAGRP